MSRMRNELIALATGMPEPGLWTGYIVLRTVKEICDAGEAAEDRASPQSQSSNVIDMRSRREFAPEEVETHPPPHADSRNVQYLADVAQSDFVAEGMRHAQQLSDQITQAEAQGHPTKLADELFCTFLQSIGLIESLREKVSRLDRLRPGINRN